MKLKLILLLLCAGQLQAGALYSQQHRFDVTYKGSTIVSVLDDLTQKTGHTFVYQMGVLPESMIVSAEMTNASLNEILESVLTENGYDYSIEGKIVIISRRMDRTQQAAQQNPAVRVTGTVRDSGMKPLAGATIAVKGTARGTVSDMNGRFELMVSRDETLVFSFLGKETMEITYTGQQTIDVQMKDDTSKIEEVVVTGLYTRKAESFTGSAVTVTGKELTRVSNQNVFQSLKNLDPTLFIADNLTMGSDPNTVPTISMRGTSSFPGETSSLKSNYQNDPNQPLFILDGFETTAVTVMDMDMNRIESITILKDAAAKAMYGSKAANGVVVIETKRMDGDQTRVSYNGNLTFEMPDLTSYDLCDAFEKLQVEVAERVYTSNDVVEQERLTKLYNYRRRLALEGLDTYWLSKPLHTGVGHKHNLNVEVGDSRSLRAYLDFTYNEDNGVMKESQRRNISGDVNISYRKNNFLFKNIFSILSNRSEDSPYGSFGSYVKMNPYWEAADQDGQVLRWAASGIANPMYDAVIGTSLLSSYTSFSNNFYAEWKINTDWKATLSLGVTDKRNDLDHFYPTTHSMFADYTTESTIGRRGQYIMENGKRSSLSGNLNINYNKSIGKHSIYSNAVFLVSETKYSAYQHVAEGFSNNQAADITFAKQYAEGSIPTGYASINREASFLLAASYDYDNRYLADATLRESASSLYGSDKRWALSWSVGLGWNLHNEAFLKDADWIEQIKLRASVGLTGNQNFSTNSAIATYQYYAGMNYEGQTGAFLSNMPNSALKWEQKKDYNFGVDMRLAGLSLSFDYYIADTENMLTDVTIPTSTGFGFVKDNLGLVRNSGVELKVNYTPWRGKNGFVTAYGSMVYTKNEIIRLSESMREYNDRMLSLAEDNQTSAPVLMYQDGLSMRTIWAVPSAGIDPQTGRELFIKKDGSYSYTYSSSDMIATGDEMPKYRGTAGFTAEYKNFGLSATLTYSAGGQRYNTTLVNRVENVDVTYNVDRRVLSGRWQETGQVTAYKGYNSTEKTRPTTRFVQDDNVLNISSISAYYEFPESIYSKLSMQRLRMSVYLNDVATFSSIKIERGTSYPFARSLSFSLTATF